MRPSERVRGMAKVDAFFQREPADGVPASQRTEVYLGYDQKNLYAAFIAFDDEPQKIRARMQRREDIWSDETVELWLDSFNDQRRAYVFACNPLGVQWDGNWIEGKGFDSSYDTVWQSQGRLTGQGFVVLMTIPFRSLRFRPAADQEWGLILGRAMPRNDESSYAPHLSAHVEGRLIQESKLIGFENISPGRNIQFVPYFSSRSARSADLQDSSNYHFSGERFAVDGGVDSKIVLKDSFVLDSTFNPDFSQVESDEPQVTVNQRFEVYFPERRPFFLENTSYFQTPLNLVFTRRIQDPQYGVRLTGKTGPYSIGALFADDQGPGKSVADDDPSYQKRALFAVVRASRDIFTSSNIGVIYTDREFNGAYNRVGGVDGRFKLSPQWVAKGQLVTSSTRDVDGNYWSGPAYTVSAARYSRNLYNDVTYSYTSPDFVSEAGYIPRTDIARVSQRTQYHFRPEDSPLISWGPEVTASRSWDHDGTMLEWRVQSEMELNFKGQAELSAFYNYAGDTLRPEDYSALPANRDYPHYSTGIWGRWDRWKNVGFSAQYGWDTRINYVTPENEPPALADGSFARFGATVRPDSRLRIDNSYNWSRIRSQQTGAALFNNHIARSKWNWQLNRELSFRFIAEYTSVLANPYLTSLKPTKNFNVDFLLTYLLHPGTALYVGYNSNLQNLDPALRADESGSLLRTRNSFINDGRQLFVKLSYLLRF